MTKPHNILVIRFSSMGDLVLTTPIFRELRKFYPQAKLTLLTSENFGSVLDNNPNLNCIIKHPRNDSFSKLNDLINRLDQENFDLIYDVHRSLRSCWIVWQLTYFGLKKNPKLLTISKRSFSRYLLINSKINFFNDVLSQRQQWLNPLQIQTTKKLNDYTELFPKRVMVKKIQSLMQKNGLIRNQFLAIAPSASYPLKCWPLSHFYNLIKMVLDKDWPVVIVGGSDDPEPEMMKEEFGERIINFSGKLSPLESAELLNHAFRLVTNDTSLNHIAEAMGTPSVVLFGPTVKEFGYAPFLPESKLLETSHELRCRPCSKDGRGFCRNSETLECLKSIHPKDVFDALKLPEFY